MKPAVVIIDMQNDFFMKKRLLEQKDSLINNINDLTSFARLKSIPVIWIKQIWKADLSNSPKHIRKSGKGYVLKGTDGSKPLEKLEVSKEDKEITKTRYSGFFKTDLDDLLSEMVVDTLIIGGINTHACVRMTAIDAWQRDLNVIIAKDCVGSYDDEHHKITLKYFDPVIAEIKSNEEIKNIL